MKSAKKKEKTAVARAAKKEKLVITTGLTFYMPRTSWKKEMPAGHVDKYCAQVDKVEKLDQAGKPVSWKITVFGNSADEADSYCVRSRKQIEEDVDNYKKANEIDRDAWLVRLAAIKRQFGKDGAR